MERYRVHERVWFVEVLLDGAFVPNFVHPFVVGFAEVPGKVEPSLKSCEKRPKNYSEEIIERGVTTFSEYYQLFREIHGDVLPPGQPGMGRNEGDGHVLREDART